MTQLLYGEGEIKMIVYINTTDATPCYDYERIVFAHNF